VISFSVPAGIHRPPNWSVCVSAGREIQRVCPDRRPLSGSDAGIAVDVDRLRRLLHFEHRRLAVTRIVSSIAPIFSVTST